MCTHTQSLHTYIGLHKHYIGKAKCTQKIQKKRKEEGRRSFFPQRFTQSKYFNAIQEENERTSKTAPENVLFPVLFLSWSRSPIGFNLSCSFYLIPNTLSQTCTYTQPYYSIIISRSQSYLRAPAFFTASIKLCDIAPLHK